MNTVISQFSLDTEFSALTENFSKGRVPCVATGVCDAARPLFCTAFSKEINTLLESIEERHKYSSQISRLESLVSTAERLIKALNSPEICHELKVIPDVSGGEPKPEGDKE